MDDHSEMNGNDQGGDHSQSNGNGQDMDQDSAGDDRNDD